MSTSKVPTREEWQRMKVQAYNDASYFRRLCEQGDALLDEVERLEGSAAGFEEDSLRRRAEGWSWMQAWIERGKENTRLRERVVGLNLRLAMGTSKREIELEERVAELEKREHLWGHLDDALTNGDDSTVYDLRVQLYPQPESDPFPPEPSND